MGTNSARLEGGVDWASASLSDLIRHILDTHHAYLRDALPKLTHQTQAAATEQPEALPALSKVFQDLRNELESHMWKEEMVLFPLIRGLEAARAAGQPAPTAHCGSVRNPIRVMEHEHDSAVRALAEMRRITNGYALPEDADDGHRTLFTGLTELEADLHQHIHLENDILHPRAAELEAGH